MLPYRKGDYGKWKGYLPDMKTFENSIDSI